MSLGLLLAYPSVTTQDDLAFLTTAPDLPATEKTVTWEAAGDPTSSPVTETTDCWSDDGGTTTYSTLRALVGAQTADVTLNMPQGEFICTLSVNHDIAYKIAIVGHASGTYIQQSSSANRMFAFDSATTTSQFHIKDLIIGAFDSEIAAHNFSTDPITNLFKHLTGFFFRRGGTGIIEGCEIRYAGQDGISAAIDYESLTGGTGTRDVSKYMIYNTEVYGCGNKTTEHNVYIHSVPTYAYRLYSHDARLGHAFKYDGEMCLLYQCNIRNIVETGEQANPGPALNYTWPGDCVAEECFIETATTGTSPQVIAINSRRNAGGRGYSKRLPPWWEQDKSYNNTRDLQWKNGSTGIPNEFYGGQCDNDGSGGYNAGTPSLTLRTNRDGYFGATGGAIPNTTTTDYWTLVWNGEVKTATKQDGTLEFVLDSTFTGTPADNDLVIVYEAASGQDTVYLNEEMWNPNHVDYYWDKVVDTGALDLTAYADIPLSLFKNSMVVEDVGTGNSRAMSVIASPGSIYVAGASPQLADLPLAPLSGESSTNTWTNAAYGSLTFGGTGDIWSGDEATSPVEVLPLLIGLAGTPLRIETSTSANDMLVKSDDNTQENYTNAPLDPTVRYIEGGTVQTASNLSTTNWWPTTYDTTTSSSVASSSTTIPVASTTGFADGQQIIIEYQTPTAGEKAVYSGTINGTPSGGNIVVTPATDRAIASGARVSAVAAAGTLPDWFLSIAYCWNTRRAA